MAFETVDIWGFTTSNRPTYADLDQVGLFLINSFSAYIGQSTKTVEQHLVRNDGLVYSFRREPAKDELLGLYWEGKLLYSVKSGLPSVDVELFLFVNRQRIGRILDRGSSILKFRGQRDEDREIFWQLQGMQSDEFEEWAYIKEPQWETQSNASRTWD